jgi:Fe-S oxidoreductase
MTTRLGTSIDRATAYCTYCPKLCRFSCPAAEAESRETVTPWGMMRLLELLRQGVVEPSKEVAEVFYHCMGCLRCQTWCKHTNDVPKAMWAARAWMRREGHVPEALEGFRNFFLEGNSPHQDSESLCGDRLAGVFDAEATIAYMPDCETRHHYPRVIARVGALLERLLGEKVRLMTKTDNGGMACCGFPLLAAGEDQEYEGYRAELEAGFEDLELVITDCAGMVSLHRDGGSWGNESTIPIVHTLSVVADHLSSTDIETPVDLTNTLLHDSCFVTRHLGLGSETRQIVATISDGTVNEFFSHGDDAPCCGGPSHYRVVSKEASQTCAEQRIAEMHREGGQHIVCSSSTCKKAFGRAEDGVADDLIDYVCDAVGIPK